MLKRTLSKEIMSLPTPLLSSLQLSEHMVSVTIDDVNRRHESLMNNGGCIDSNKLIKILGGADAILKHYISTNELSPLSSEQLSSINELLIPTNERQVDMESVASDTNEIENPVLLIHQKNTFNLNPSIVNASIVICSAFSCTRWADHVWQ